MKDSKPGDIEPRDTETGELTAAEETAAADVPRPTRRALIASIGGLLGAALTRSLTRAGDAHASGIPVSADCPNPVIGTTQLDRSQRFGAVEPVFQVDAGDYTALRATSTAGVGLVGISAGAATMTMTVGTRAAGAFLADSGTGVVGVHSIQSFSDVVVEEASRTPAGVTGVAPSAGFGVVGIGNVATGAMGVLLPNPGSDPTGVLGVQGQPGLCCAATPTITGGVVGLTAEGTGVYGATATATGVGVFASNPNGGVALRVTGAAAFSTTGEGLIPPKTLEHDVQDPNVGLTSHVVVTFTSPAKKLFVSWVEIVEGFGFRMHLSKKQKLPVSYSYLVLERDS